MDGVTRPPPARILAAWLMLAIVLGVVVGMMLGW